MFLSSIRPPDNSISRCTKPLRRSHSSFRNRLNDLRFSDAVCCDSVIVGVRQGSGTDLTQFLHNLGVDLAGDASVYVWAWLDGRYSSSHILQGLLFGLGPRNPTIFEISALVFGCGGVHELPARAARDRS